MKLLHTAQGPGSFTIPVEAGQLCPPSCFLRQRAFGNKHIAMMLNEKDNPPVMVLNHFYWLRKKRTGIGHRLEGRLPGRKHLKPPMLSFYQR